MKQSRILLLVFLCLVAAGLFVRWQMGRQRESPAVGIDLAATPQETREPSTGNSEPEKSAPPPAVPSSTEKRQSAEDTNKPADPIGTLLDTAVKTAGGLDRIGLEITRMSDADEAALGAEIDKEVLRHTRTVTDAASQRRIEKLAAPLIDQRRRKAIKYTVRILDSDTANAYRVAGGYIYFTRAFLKQFPSDAAIAMTLGHEIGHVDLRHCVEKLQYQAAGKQIVGDLASLAQLAYTTMRSAYTKDQEFEADQYGFEAARKAGWKSEELLGFIRGLAAYERKQTTKGGIGETRQSEVPLATKLAEYLASHPPTEERLRRLEAQSAER